MMIVAPKEGFGLCMENNNSFYFSIFGGYIYEANIDEEKTLDPFQIPLIEKPKPILANDRAYAE
jgi:hypothetical protein